MGRAGESWAEQGKAGQGLLSLLLSLLLLRILVTSIAPQTLESAPPTCHRAVAHPISIEETRGPCSLTASSRFQSQASIHKGNCTPKARPRIRPPNLHGHLLPVLIGTRSWFRPWSRGLTEASLAASSGESSTFAARSPARHPSMGGQGKVGQSRARRGRAGWGRVWEGQVREGQGKAGER